MEEHNKSNDLNKFIKPDEIKVDLKPLDKFCTDENIDRIDFIKIDVEGMEYDVLMGGNDSIEKYKPTLCIEIWDPENLKNIQNDLSEIGYTMKKIQGYDYLFIHKQRII